MQGQMLSYMVMRLMGVTCMMTSPLLTLLRSLPSTVVGKARYPEMPTIRYPIMMTMMADTITPSIPICADMPEMPSDASRLLSW